MATEAEVKATGLSLFSPVMQGSLGSGMMVELLKHEGTSHSASELLNI